ncbi:hypothetical protein ACIRF8_15125 [Streptomyces sp. NPDC102406]|uniref:hypothetical protein n=1 Tax=Streptomyces sp. NPDC102406 TaxID=3366171 RepID=UPI0037F7489C
MTVRTMHQQEADLRTALASLAERWEQMAKAGPDFGDNLFIDEPTPVQLQQHERAVTYRRAAADLRDVLRTGRIPHGLMTNAELDEHGAKTGDES